MRDCLVCHEQFDEAIVIEKNIFQTYKTPYNNLGEYAKITSSTWIDKNPNWEYNYYSDDDILDFVRENFGLGWLDIFVNCPIGVMKSDIWRCMVIYKHGGVYADLDTICTESIDAWIPKNSNVIFSLGADGFIQNFVFLAKSESKILENILINIEKSLNLSRIINIDYVYNTTGPAVLTKSINEYISSGNNDITIIKDLNFFTSGKTVHLNAARFWKFDSYDSWNDELERKINEIV